jgi:RND family efflux transporter MFP subunit
MRYLTLSIVAVMPALLCAACVKKPEQAPAVVPPTVTVQTPQVREVTTYEEFVGRCEAVQSVELRARVTGILETQEFEDSQIVNEGDLLFTIEDAPYRAAVASAQAALAAREADLHLAQINLDKAQQAYEREAVTEIEMAKVTADRDAAQAAVQGAQAALDTAKIDLGYTKIYAPMTGRISRALIDVGNLIGGLPPTPLTSIVQDDPVHVFFDVDERSVLKRLEERPRETRDGRERLPAFLQLLDGTRYGESGVIDYAANRIDANTGTLTVRASIPNPNGRLYAGMFVRVLLPDETGEQLLIPEVALQRDLAGSYVLVVDEHNIVNRRILELGRRVDTLRIVRAGLAPTDRVIVNGLQRAIDGQPVTPQEAPPPPSPSTAPTVADDAVAPTGAQPEPSPEPAE